MKKSLVMVASICVILVGICIWQARELAAQERRALRTEMALHEEQRTRAEQESASRYLQRREREWREKVMELSALVGKLRESEAAQASNYARLAETSAASGGTQTNEAAGGSSGMFGKGMGEMISRMMKDPNMREFMRAQQKTVLKKMYGPLTRDLNLPAEQQQKLMDLLLDQQMDNIESSQGMLTGEKLDFQRVAETAKERQKQHDAAIQELLGGEKFAEYENYKKTMAERMQLSEFEEQLQETEWPLRAEQTTQILAVIKEERDRTPPVSPPNATAQAQDVAGVLASEQMERHIQWQEELNRRVQERLGPILSPEQLKAYIALQEQQLTMQKFGIKMAREMFGKDASGDQK